MATAKHVAVETKFDEALTQQLHPQRLPVKPRFYSLDALGRMICRSTAAHEATSVEPSN